MRHNDVRTIRERMRDRAFVIWREITDWTDSGILDYAAILILVCIITILILVVIAPMINNVTNSLTEAEEIGQLRSTPIRPANQETYYLEIVKADGTPEVFRVYSTAQYQVDVETFIKTLEPGSWYRFRIYGRSYPRVAFKAEPVENPLPPATEKSSQ